MMPAARVALYLRVSLETGAQTTDNQLPECTALAQSRGTIVQVYREQRSAAKVRPVFASMLEDAKASKFDVLVVWALDRFGRSMHGNLRDMLTLDELGVRVLSVREPWLDADGPMRQLLVAITSWVAEHERARISERVKAGLARVKASGKRLGRLPCPVDVPRARYYASLGFSQRGAARELGVPLATLQRAMRRSAGNGRG